MLKLLFFLDNIADVRIFGHHKCHAAEAWGSYSNKYENNLVVTFDGGGWDFTRMSSSKTHISVSQFFVPVLVISLSIGITLLACPISRSLSYWASLSALLTGLKKGQ